MKVHLIGNAHIDPVWLWRWQEGFAEIKATFAAACERIRDYDDFIFTSACASYYEWAEENAPDLFEQIRTYVKAGRWVLVGGWWLQPDCNLPSGESFARHALYSQRYFFEKFGVTATVGYNVDSFGHSVSLPKLLRAAGMDAYVFMRPGDHEKELPTLFWWESPDGSRVLTTKINATYGDRLDDLPAALERLRVSYPGDSAPLFYGVGNHGGGPTVKMIETIRAFRNDTDTLIFSDPRRFADAARSLPDLPVVRDDLQHHASGCYSTLSAHKKANRTAEARLLAAERWDTVASALFSVPAAGAKLTEAWKTVLFNQFHDIMGGCSIREAYDDALAAMGGAIHTADVVCNAALQRISWAIDTKRGKKVPLSKDYDFRTWENDMGGAPHVVFNPHPFPISTTIQLISAQTRVEDENGAVIPIQSVRASRTNGDDKFDTLLSLDMPPLSYRTVFTYRAKPSPDFESPFVITDDSISNGLVTIKIDAETGGLAELTVNGQNRLAAPCTARVIDCSDADTWAHAIFTFDREDGRFFGERVALKESGPIRATIRVTSRYHSSTLTQDFSLVAGDDTVHVTVHLDWREENRMLKLCFPVAGEHARATYEQPYGYITRDHDSHEEPGHAWVEVGGLTLVNDAKYSYSLTPVSDGYAELRLTAVRSAIFADHYGHRDDDCVCMDIGRQNFRYTLRVHDGAPDYADNFRHARLLCMPPEVVPETFHEGKLPLQASFAEVDRENVLLEVIKPGEAGGIVLRIFETSGIPTQATIKLPFLEKSVLTDLGAYEVKTLLLQENGVKEVKLYEI
ncbi:MAG: glycoside hydrolase family 38 C-terminal domain-containing protein [Clostridiaceae bacterium]|nr:glycoside hydrolase family 38 C-terminal domain-containing protein [Clostridiaceae bacterium]